MQKKDWYFVLFWLMVVVIVGLNEIGLGVVSLLLLYPVFLLMQKGLEKEKPSD